MSDSNDLDTADDLAYADSSGRVLWGRILFWTLALGLMFLLGRACAPEPTSDAAVLRLQSQVTELSSENAILEQELRAQEAGGTDDEAEPEVPPEADAGETEAPEDVEAQDEAEAPAPAEPQAEVDGEALAEAEPAPDTDTYTVVAGDTLRGIAQQVYGDPEQAGRIVDENGLDRDAPLRVGQELRIPRG